MYEIRIEAMLPDGKPRLKDIPSTCPAHFRSRIEKYRAEFRAGKQSSVKAKPAVSDDRDRDQLSRRLALAVL